MGDGHRDQLLGDAGKGTIGEAWPHLDQFDLVRRDDYRRDLRVVDPLREDAGGREQQRTRDCDD